ncbi:MAG: ApaG domain [Bacteroidetes bacterium]|nr:ApaG domain [Bacteroidota bacterium]
MITKVTNGIKVSVKTNYDPKNSNIFRFEYIFRYRIRIENTSMYTVQLLKRKWTLFDSIGDYRDIEGKAVSGRHQVLEPGSKYEYESYFDLYSDIGKMKGYYELMRMVDKQPFKVDLPEIYFIVPFKLN